MSSEHHIIPSNTHLLPPFSPSVWFVFCVMSCGPSSQLCVK